MRPSRLIICIAALLIVLSFAVPGFAQDPSGLSVVASGELEGYYAPSSGNPVPGEGQVVFDGTRFAVFEMTTDRLLKAFWYSADGTFLKQQTIDDFSESYAELSQPSACVLNGDVYVAYVGTIIVEDTEYDYTYEDTAQYIAKISYGSNSVQKAVVRDNNVKPRRAGIAADGEGMLLVFRDYDNKCYARYINADLSMGTEYQVYDDGWDSFAIYPWITYAPETEQFLILIQQYGNSVGALVDKNTTETPEPIVIIEQSNYYEQPRSAWNGEKFLITAHYSGGIVAAELYPDGNVKKSSTLLALNHVADNYYTGMILWDGSEWLVAYSQSKNYDYWGDVGKTPDFRWTDSYIAVVDPDTLDVKETVGVATGWWHQTHMRFAFGTDNSLFCVYNQTSGDGTTLRWCLLEGELSGKSRASASSGLSMSANEDFNYANLGSSNGSTAYALAGTQLYRKSAGGSWTIVTSDTCNTTDYYDLSVAADASVALSGWSGLAQLGANSANVQLEGSFNMTGEVPATGIYSAGGKLFVCASEGTIWRGNTDAQSLTCVYNYGKLGSDFHDISGSSASNVWAVGDWGMVVHYDGSAWTEVATPVCVSLNAVYVDERDTVWAVGDDGTILRIEDGECTLCSTPVSTSLMDIWGYRYDMVFASGEKGTVLMYNGSSWKTVSLPEEVDERSMFASVFGLANGTKLTVYAVNRTDGGVYSMVVDIPQISGPMISATLSGNTVTYSLRSDVPDTAVVMAASYDASGRMLSAVKGSAGTAVIPGTFSEVRVLLLNKNFKPLWETVELSPQ